MADATWPASLPQSLDSSGFGITQQDNVVRTSVAMGKPKQRPRYTAVSDEVTGSMVINKDEINTFLYFWEAVLSFGTLPFNWKHPIKETDIVAEFTDQYSISHISGYQYRLSLKFRVLP